jgi:hypothetical protein
MTFLREMGMRDAERSDPTQNVLGTSKVWNTSPSPLHFEPQQEKLPCTSGNSQQQ